MTKTENNLKELIEFGHDALHNNAEIAPVDRIMFGRMSKALRVMEKLLTAQKAKKEYDRIFDNEHITTALQKQFHEKFAEMNTTECEAETAIKEWEKTL